MTKKLFLSSSFVDVENLFSDIFGSSLSDKTVAFIPTASLHEEVTFYVKEAKKILEKLGLHVKELEISTASPSEISSVLQSSDIIYVSGGNTFFLLQELRKSGADKTIIEQINSGKLYIGESAGSIVLAPNIKYIKEMDDSSVVASFDDYSGLDVVNFYPLPHFGEFPFEDATKKISAEFNNILDLKPITNSQAIYLDASSISILG